MEIVVNHSDKKIRLNVRPLNRVERFLGLMFRSRETKNLLFDFGTNTRVGFHSLFVFFPFLILWLDDKNNVIHTEVAKPFKLRIKCEKEFNKVIELPLNKRNQKIFRVFK